MATRRNVNRFRQLSDALDSSDEDEPREAKRGQKETKANSPDEEWTPASSARKRRSKKADKAKPAARGRSPNAHASRSSKDELANSPRRRSKSRTVSRSHPRTHISAAQRDISSRSKALVKRINLSDSKKRSPISEDELLNLSPEARALLFPETEEFIVSVDKPFPEPLLPKGRVTSELPLKKHIWEVATNVVAVHTARARAQEDSEAALAFVDVSLIPTKAWPLSYMLKFKVASSSQLREALIDDLGAERVQYVHERLLRLQILNLPFHWRESHLDAALSVLPSLGNHGLKIDGLTGLSRGIAWLEYPWAKRAELRSMPKRMGDRKITVKVETPQKFRACSCCFSTGHRSAGCTSTELCGRCCKPRHDESKDCQAAPCRICRSLAHTSNRCPKLGRQYTKVEFVGGFEQDEQGVHLDPDLAEGQEEVPDRQSRAQGPFSILQRPPTPVAQYAYYQPHQAQDRKSDGASSMRPRAQSDSESLSAMDVSGDTAAPSLGLQPQHQPQQQFPHSPGPGPRKRTALQGVQGDGPTNPGESLDLSESATPAASAQGSSIETKEADHPGSSQAPQGGLPRRPVGSSPPPRSVRGRDGHFHQIPAWPSRVPGPSSSSSSSSSGASSTSKRVGTSNRSQQGSRSLSSIPEDRLAIPTPTAPSAGLDSVMAMLRQMQTSMEQQQQAFSAQISAQHEHFARQIEELKLRQTSPEAGPSAAAVTTAAQQPEMASAIAAAMEQMSNHFGKLLAHELSKVSQAFGRMEQAQAQLSASQANLESRISDLAESQHSHKSPTKRLRFAAPTPSSGASPSDADQTHAHHQSGAAAAPQDHQHAPLDFEPSRPPSSSPTSIGPGGRQE
jgi:hypothetical protein